jgi:DNA-binding transcriptional LysR family regulator
VILGKATMEGRMFASAKYVEEFGKPTTMDELLNHPACIMDHFLNPNLGGGDWTRYANLLADHKNISWQCDSALGLGFAIRSGWGLGSQPSLVELTEPGMVMLEPEVYSVKMQFWLVAHKDIKDNPAPRILANWIKERMIPSFMGRAQFEVMF